MSVTLYERLGGLEGTTNIANDLIDFHYENPIISTRFKTVNKNNIKQAAATFISTGTGGPENYMGKSMLQTHKGMNISAAEFMAVLDDALNALNKNNIGQPEQEELLFILYSLRKEIVLV